MPFDAGTAVVQILPSTTGFAALLQKQIGGALASIKAQAAASGAGIAQAFNVAGIGIGVALAAATVKGVADFQRLGAEVRTLEVQLGTTAEQASVLRAQAEALGISTDSLSRGFGIFAKNLVNGSTALEKYGITASKTADGQIDFEATLTDLAARFQALPPGIEQTAFAMNLFGRSGKQMIPLLRASSDELKSFADNARDAGLIMSEEDVLAARALSIASRELRASFEGLSVSLARAVVPALTSLTDGLARFVRFINPVIPAIRDLFVAFLGFKLLSFVPALLFQIALGLEAIGAAAAADATAGFAAGLAGLAALGGPIAIVAVGLTALGLATQKLRDAFMPTTPAIEIAGKVVTDLKARLAAGTITIAKAREVVARFNATIGELPGVANLSADAITRTAEASRDQAVALAAANVTTHAFVGEFAGLARGITAIAADTGTAFGDVKDAVTGLVRDTTHAFAENKNAALVWGKGVKAQLDSVRSAFVTFRDSTATSLDFAASRFDALASDFTGSAHKIATALENSLGAERDFAKNLSQLLKDPGKGADLLVQQLAALGPAGAGAAAKIAGANDKIRASIEGSLRKSQQFASDTAVTLQRKILGTLNDIRGFFDALTKALEQRLTIDLNDDDIIKGTTDTKGLIGQLGIFDKAHFFTSLDVDTSQANAAIEALRAKIAALVASHPTVNVGVLLRSGGGGVDNDPTTPWASGFHGVISKPTLALIGEAGPERVDVGPVGSGGGGGRIHGQLAVADWRRGLFDLDAELEHLGFVSPN